MTVAAAALRVTEIYRSLSGESVRAGWPCTLVRMTGCGLRCRWCDTAYAFTGGSEMSVAEILAAVRRHGTDLVLVTGGEPLEQPGVEDLLQVLAEACTTVMVETGGHVDIRRARAATTVVLDLKAPGSGMEPRNLWSNLQWLRGCDEIKIVLADRADYEWARAQLAERRVDGRALHEICPVALSPAWGELAASDLAAWILADRLPVRLNLQMHKILWPHADGGV